MLVNDYIRLGFELGKHIDGLVDAYYGPTSIVADIKDGPKLDPRKLVEDAHLLMAALDSGASVDGLGTSGDEQRRRWIRSQVIGLLTVARKLSGESIDYVTEVELCYGVKPRKVPLEEIEHARAILDKVFPGTGDLRDRLTQYRESFAVPVDKLGNILNDLADMLRERTQEYFGLPEGERIDFEIVSSKPWSGFNYYLGNLRSKVAINSDLPILSTSLAHLVAHEAYPGHHSEHTRKEVDLVIKRNYSEESIFLVGTPQCLMAEGLADFGLEILLGNERFEIVSDLMKKNGVSFPDQEIEQTNDAFETLGKVRANAAWDLHQDGVAEGKVIEMMERDALLSRARAEKAVEFLTDSTWRAYITCYVEGYQLVRSFVGNANTITQQTRIAKFKRLLTEQLTPADIVS